jgi:hypothetical protein
MLYMSTLYYNKYLKYKNKYLQHKNILQGGTNLEGPTVVESANIEHKYVEIENIFDRQLCIEFTDGQYDTLKDCEEYNIWKEQYIQLYSYLLLICNNNGIYQINILHTLCVSLFTKLNNIRIDYNKRLIDYNMRLLINALTILINDNSLDSLFVDYHYNNIHNKSLLEYYMEDAYTDDIVLFYSEYNKLVDLKKSAFFYRSNLVNISILLRCFSSRCIQKIEDSDPFYSELKEYIPVEKLANFESIKIDLIKHLLEAYIDFSYNKVNKLYLSFIHFTNTFEIPFKTINPEYKDEVILKNITKIIESGSEYFLYLSCIIPSIVRFQKFEATKLLISYIGFKKNGDNFINPLDTINHDLYDHNQFGRKISYTNENISFLQNFYSNLYIKFKTNSNVLNGILTLIHEGLYEQKTDLPLTLRNIIVQSTRVASVDLYKFLLSLQTNNFIDNSCVREEDYTKIKNNTITDNELYTIVNCLIQNNPNNKLLPILHFFKDTTNKYASLFVRDDIYVLYYNSYAIQDMGYMVIFIKYLYEHYQAVFDGDLNLMKIYNLLIQINITVE